MHGRKVDASRVNIKTGVDTS